MRSRELKHPPTEAPCDAVLIDRSAAGEEAAFSLLVKRYERLVWACARTVAGNETDAADAAQETFIRFHRRLDQFNPDRPLKPYLAKIAVNCARNTLAARRRNAVLRERFIEMEQGRSQAGPDAVLLAQERRASVRRQIAALPPVLRQVCSLFYLAECSCREISENLSMSETAVKVALHRARRRLAPALTQWRTAP